MKQNQKELLLRDLCVRLPYGVKAHIRYWSNWSNQYCEGVFTIESVNPSTKYLHASSEKCFTEGTVGQDCDFVIKPYLFPMSSMTEEQRKELFYLSGIDIINGKFYTNNEFTLEETLSGINWLLKNHFDINGLIPMGLAIDCTNLNIY